MVKFFGIVFLGQPREAALGRAHDCGPLERVGMLWLAAGCVALGLFPAQVVAMLETVTAELLGHSLGRPLAPGGCSHRCRTGKCRTARSCSWSWPRA